MVVFQRIKKFPQTVCRRKKNSCNRPLKNKTIPQTVSQGINNFHKPFIASISNMSKCLKMFIFIIRQSSNIQWYEPSYRWKYGFKLFEICLYYISKNSPKTSKIWHTIVGYPTTDPPHVIVNSTNIIANSTLGRCISDELSSTCRQKTYAKDVGNSTLIKEIRSYNNFHHFNSTNSYFTSDVIGFWVQILLCFLLLICERLCSIHMQHN